MKMYTQQFKILLLATIFLAGIPSWAQTFERSKTVTRSFAASQATEIQVTNKYGNINLIPWDQDSVRFEIELTVKASKQTKLDNTFDYIDFDFKATQYYIIAQTTFQGQSDLWTEISDMAKSMFSSGMSTQINYTVYFPKENEVRIDNKFGNIYTTDHRAKATFSLSNGDLIAHSLASDAQIKLEFGSATIEDIKRGKLNLSYGEVNIEKCEFLEIDSRSSEIDLTSARDLKINSKRDKIRLKNVTTLTGEISYSTLNITEIQDNLEMKLYYGIFSVDRLGNSLDYLTLNSQYSDITLTLRKETGHDVSITYNDRTQITWPSIPFEKTESVVSAEDKIKKAEFHLGPNVINSIPITLRTNAGKVYLKISETGK